MMTRSFRRPFRRSLGVMLAAVVMCSTMALPARGAPRPVIAYQSSVDSPDSNIRIRYSDGSETVVDIEGLYMPPAAGAFQIASWFSISPDGKKIAFTAWNAACAYPTSTCHWTEGAIYTVNIDGTALTPIYYPPSDFWVANPEWSPDGERVMFVSYYYRNAAGRKPHSDLWVLDETLPGVWSASKLVARRGGEKWPEWSPDGRFVTYEYQPDDDGFIQKGELENGTTIAVSAVDGSSHTDLTSVEGFETDPAFSPDGERIAYADYDAPWASDGAAIRVLDLDSGNKTTLADGLRYPWALDYSPDGRHIAFGEGWKWNHTRIMTVRAEGPGRTQVLIDNFDVSDHLPEYFPAP